MSDSNPIALHKRTSLIVYEPDIFNCSRQPNAVFTLNGRLAQMCHQPRANDVSSL
jgi:hypothetical protein